MRCMGYQVRCATCKMEGAPIVLIEGALWVMIINGPSFVSSFDSLLNVCQLMPGILNTYPD